MSVLTHPWTFYSSRKMNSSSVLATFVYILLYAAKQCLSDMLFQENLVSTGRYVHIDGQLLCDKWYRWEDSGAVEQGGI